MKQPKVSVIIPSYNHALFIDKAIRSVLRQDYTDYELLILDDCSSDHSVEVISSFKDARIKTFFLSENIGAAEALEFLIEKAQGEYLALLNSDDEWLDEKLSKQVQVLDADENIGACFTWAKMVDEHSKEYTGNDVNLNTFMAENKTRFEWLHHFFHKGNCICHPSMLIRKEIYEKLGCYNGAYRQLPDFLFWIQVCSEYEIFIMQEVLVYHRRTVSAGENTSCVSDANSNRNVSEAMCIMKNLIGTLPDETFRKAFQKDFVRKQAQTHEELICERYFLLLKGAYVNTRIAAVQFFMDHYTKPNVAKCFKEQYDYKNTDFHKENQIGPNDFSVSMFNAVYEIVSQMFYTDDIFADDKVFLLKPKITEQEKLQYQFTLLQDCKKLRFDPLEGAMIAVNSICVFKNEDELKVQSVEAERIDDKMYFVSADPQFMMTSDFKKGDEITIELDLAYILKIDLATQTGGRFVLKNTFATEKAGAVFANMVQAHNLAAMDALNKEIEEIKNRYENSLSFRITKPLRAIRNLFAK